MSTQIITEMVNSKGGCVRRGVKLDLLIRPRGGEMAGRYESVINLTTLIIPSLSLRASRRLCNSFGLLIVMLTPKVLYILQFHRLL